METGRDDDDNGSDDVMTAVSQCLQQFIQHHVNVSVLSTSLYLLYWL